jgi:hypothetical protein
LLLAPGTGLSAQSPRIAAPVASVVLQPEPSGRWGVPRRAGDTGLPLTGMAIGAGVLGIPVVICAIDGRPDGDFFGCDLRTILGAAAVGALVGGLIEGLVSPAQPRDSSAQSSLSGASARSISRERVAGIDIARP